MSQEKAQLIAPLGHFTVPGLNVSGVVTATSFSGNCTGTASSIVKGTNVVVGVMTASSFVGDVTGNVTGIGSNTDNLDVGVVTATSFAGNFTGIGSGLTGTPNVVAGVVTATKFVGNTPGTVSKLADGTNINVGVVTATKFVGNTSGLAAGIAAAQNINVGVLTATGGLYGDGSGLTGAGSTAFIRQTVKSDSSTTSINLNNGNIILYQAGHDTTVSFANTSTAEEVTFIRDLDAVDYSISFAAGGIVLDGSDYVNNNGWAGATMMLSDFCIEYFWNGSASGSTTQLVGTTIDSTSGSWITGTRFSNNNCVFFGRADGSSFTYSLVDVNVNDGNWHHIAIQRLNKFMYIYVDGVRQTIASYLHSTSSTNYISGNCNAYTELYVGYNANASAYATGTISNIRLSQNYNGSYYGTGRIYDGSDRIRVPVGPLAIPAGHVASWVIGTSTSDVTASGGQLSLETGGDPTSFNGTVGTINAAMFSTNITWPSSVEWDKGITPPIIGTERGGELQVFHLNTCDAGLTWYGYEEVLNNPQGNQLWTWGSNAFGSLGHNNTTLYSSPVQIPGGWNFVSSSYHTLASKPDGTLWAWGRANNGGLGLNAPVNSHKSSPTQIPGTDWSNNISVSASGSSAAFKKDGTLWVWGRNISGELGQNSVNPSSGISSPVQVQGTWDSRSQKHAPTDNGHLAIRLDGTLWAWGDGYAGSLGINVGGNGGHRSSPIQIGAATDWDQVAGAWAQGFALRSNNLYTWGANNQGQLGLNDTTNRSSPAQVPGTTWKTMPRGNGVYLMGAIKTDGTLWMWGYNNRGQLGQNNVTPYSSPKQIPGTTWHSLTLGSYEAAATKTDGTMWAWGWNPSGQLGQNNVIAYSSPIQIPGRFTPSGKLGWEYGGMGPSPSGFGLKPFSSKEPI